MITKTRIASLQKTIQKVWLQFLLLVVVAGLLPNQTVGQISAEEFATRRTALLSGAGSGLVLLKANSSEKEMEQAGWIQNVSFYYFTGLGEQPSAILVLDGPRHESHLFVPPDPLSFGVPVEGLSESPGVDTAQRLGLTSVRPWDEFETFILERLDAGVSMLYIERPRRPKPTGVPEGMLTVSGNMNLWEESVRASFPDAAIESISNVVTEMRWVKSSEEIEILRQNAQMTTSAIAMLDLKTGVDWHIHGVGVESGESPGSTIRSGNVLAYEPMFIWQDDAYYLEDMILVTDGGAEILSTGLPYSSIQISDTMKKARDTNR